MSQSDFSSLEFLLRTRYHNGVCEPLPCGMDELYHDTQHLVSVPTIKPKAVTDIRADQYTQYRRGENDDGQYDRKKSRVPCAGCHP